MNSCGGSGPGSYWEDGDEAHRRIRLRNRDRKGSVSRRIPRDCPRWFRPEGGVVSVRGTGVHPGDAAGRVAKTGSLSWGQNPWTDSDRSLQMDGYLRVARDPAPRLQVLWADAAGSLFQGGS